jgi:hypothetical protein
MLLQYCYGLTDGVAGRHDGVHEQHLQKRNKTRTACESRAYVSLRNVFRKPGIHHFGLMGVSV